MPAGYACSPKTREAICWVRSSHIGVETGIGELEAVVGEEAAAEVVELVAATELVVDAVDPAEAVWVLPVLVVVPAPAAW